MRLSKNESLSFDVSSILADISLPASHNGLDSSSSGVIKDEVLTMLEKIAMTGQQLQTELQSAKLKEASLIREAELKMSNCLQLSPVKSPFHCDCCSEKKFQPAATGNLMALKERCEKLQDALLSLEEENIRLNRLLMHSSHMDDGSHGSQDEAKKKLTSKELEVEKLQERLSDLDKKLSESVQSQSLKYRNEDDAPLHTLCSSLKDRANDLEYENTKYLERIQNLETQLELQSGDFAKEDTYKHRIDDLHNLLVAKEREIGKLRDELSYITEQYHEKDKRTGAVLNRDISKRKEVLLLCEKYELLRKRMKRLENELSTSQDKLKSSTSAIFELETTCQRVVEENGVLKHQLMLLQGLVHSSKRTKDYNSTSRLLKDYERLTEKFESLRDLRLREYEKLEAVRNKPASRKQNVGTQKKEHRIKDHGGSVVDDDPMWRRKQDFRQCFMGEGVLASARYHNDWQHKRSKIQKFHDNFINKSERHPHKRSNRHLTAGDALTVSTVSFRAQKDGASCDIENYPHGLRSHMHPHTTSIEVNSTKEQAGQCSSKKSNPQLLCEENVISLPIDAKTMPSSRIQRKFSNDFNIQKSAVNPGANPSLLLKPPSSVAMRCRSRSLSPAQHHNFFAQKNEFEASISLESQKSVTFAPSLNHLRSKSTSDIDSTPGRNISHGNAVSPAEVLRKVKSAYQEEYVRNMKGVDLTLSCSDVASKKLSDGFTQKGVPLHCGERYKTTIQNVHNYIEKASSIIPSGVPTQSRYIVTALPLSKSTSQGILKKPQSSNMTSSIPRVVTMSPVSVIPSQMIASPILDGQKPSIVVREKDLSYLQVVETKKVNTSAWNESVEIVDISSTGVHQANSRSSYLKSSVSKQQEILGTEEDRSSGEHGTMKNRLSLNDLITPIQLSKSLKDDDTESQSSLSSAKDHIGRFEFLQDMQSVLKNPSFAFQRKESDEANTTARSSIKYENPELGLSARQQEYAEKLIKKYTRKSLMT